jgi:hypothetical protein
MDALSAIVTGLTAVAGPNLWWMGPLIVAVVVLRFPMPGRGPRSSRRDPWRGFKYAARAEVFARAGDRCEGAAFFAWGRCGRIAFEVDHVYPHSKGGPTVVRNGQALCHGHNSRKGSMTPAWWYILTLERRRRSYFPEGSDVRVFAVMTAGDMEARRRWERKQRS